MLSSASTTYLHYDSCDLNSKWNISYRKSLLFIISVSDKLCYITTDQITHTIQQVYESNNQYIN